MHMSDWINISFYFLCLFLLSPILGKYIAKIFSKEENGKIEGFIYKFLRIDIGEQRANAYLKDLLQLSFVGFVLFFLIVQIPGAEQRMTWHLALNTAISFVTNTNWQAYSGEVSLTPIMQMLAATVQNFISAGTGIAVFIALTRGLGSKGKREIGNFWKDLTRSIIYLLLPLSLVLSFLLAGQGVVQTLDSNKEIITIENKRETVPLGPVASQVAIKQLGTNGGGYFGVNSAHPYENPTPFSNFLESLAILLIPCSLVFTFGLMLNRKKHAYVILGVMTLTLFIGLGVSLYNEYGTNTGVGLSLLWEGKEWRFSRAESVIWSTATTAASNGSVNSMHASLSPLSGMVALFNIMLGEIIFGGVGAGMYGMIVFIILTVFMSGLMIGRTPEYLLKKISTKDIKLVLIALIAPICTILLGASLSTMTDIGLNSKISGGPHGLSEILYAWSSAGGNNGSAFASFNANNLFHNTLLGIAMIIGRFGVIIPCLLLADSFSGKKLVAQDSGQMSTDNTLFGILLFGIIFIIGALTFFPALLLGPVMEHLLMGSNVLF